ncbi:Diacylglycerol kinase [Zostera marina]|uniref:Diacylglycerol kinase n=1 Tax=Zostera marina TaxID=29655 RepID=A0A0K9PW17_ZOSMR|nr:Diacylglycerol kinase [Zostera marina]
MENKDSTSSFVNTLRGFGLGGIKIDREELKKQTQMPKYLREAMDLAIRSKNAQVVAREVVSPSISAEIPIVVFINEKSGGRLGPALKVWFQEFLGPEQVFDILDVNPSVFVQYGLACLENLASLGDDCARKTRQNLRIVTAGGDGTVGWVLSCLAELSKKRKPVPSTGVIPLGTGNDLSRTFDWGSSFPFLWRSAVKSSIHKATTGRIRHLDSWEVVVSMPSGKSESLKLPHSLKKTEDLTLAHNVYDGDIPDEASCFAGVFYNYFSIGMDAQVAYGFHHLRNKKPYLAQGPISNKMIYSGYSCSQGWFCTSCISDPGLRGLKNIMHLSIKKDSNCSEWENIHVPKSVRAIVVLNLPNYGSGRHPWGSPKPDYLEKRDFVEAHVDDGLIEIVGLKQGWHASFVMSKIISGKHITQAAAVRFELKGGEWKKAYMQMDGEPWKQPIDNDLSTFVEVSKVPHYSVMISGE